MAAANNNNPLPQGVDKEMIFAIASIEMEHRVESFNKFLPSHSSLYVLLLILIHNYQGTQHTYFTCVFASGFRKHVSLSVPTKGTRSLSSTCKKPLASIDVLLNTGRSIIL